MFRSRLEELVKKASEKLESHGIKLKDLRVHAVVGLGSVFFMGIGYFAYKRATRRIVLQISRSNSSRSINASQHSYPKIVINRATSFQTPSNTEERILQPVRSFENALSTSFIKMESIPSYKVRIFEQKKQEDLEQNMLSKELLLLLNDCIIASFIPKFKVLTDKNREKRRKFLEKRTRELFRNYEKLCLEEIENFDYGIQATTQEVLTDVNIDMNNFYTSLNYHTTIDTGFHQRFMIMYEKLKVANREKKKDLSLEKGMEILRRQIELMEMDDGRVDSLLDEETRKPIKQILVNDTIFMEFGIEEEDVLLNQIEKVWEKVPEYFELVNKLQSLF